MKRRNGIFCRPVIECQRAQRRRSVVLDNERAGRPTDRPGRPVNLTLVAWPKLRAFNWPAGRPAAYLGRQSLRLGICARTSWRVANDNLGPAGCKLPPDRLAFARPRGAPAAHALKPRGRASMTNARANGTRRVCACVCVFAASPAHQARASSKRIIGDHKPSLQAQVRAAPAAAIAASRWAGAGPLGRVSSNCLRPPPPDHRQVCHSGRAGVFGATSARV